MQKSFYASSQTGLYRETSPNSGANPFAYVWPHSRALVGTLALAGIAGLDMRRDVKDRLAALAWYWDGRAYASYVQPPYGHGGDRYSDDNTWVALALVRAPPLARRSSHSTWAFLMTDSGCFSGSMGIWIPPAAESVRSSTPFAPMEPLTPTCGVTTRV
jgi:hypothetical protein